MFAQTIVGTGVLDGPKITTKTATVYVRTVGSADSQISLCKDFVETFFRESFQTFKELAEKSVKGKNGYVQPPF